METQGSSLSSLRNSLASLVSNAGKPIEAGAATGGGNASNAVSREQMIQLSKQLQEDMRRVNTNIDFSYNEEIKGLVVTVREANGERVIREIPSEEAIEIMRKMREMIGNIFDARA